MSFLKRLFGIRGTQVDERNIAPNADEPLDSLPDEIHDRITQLSAEGDALAESRNFEGAISKYREAWGLLPEPQNHWNASTWLIAALADAYFLSGDFGAAGDALEFGMTCPDALGNPFLHLRLGQVSFLAGDKDRAADELMRAYMGAGADIFEAEDSQYLEFLKSRALI